MEVVIGQSWKLLEALKVRNLPSEFKKQTMVSYFQAQQWSLLSKVVVNS